MADDDWRDRLAEAREQRGVDRNLMRRAWDERWCRWWRKHVDRGATPNQAVPLATRMTVDQLGRRPAAQPAGEP